VLGNELWCRRVETVSEDVIARVVEGHRVSFAIACLRGEGQPVGHLVVLALEVLGAEPVVFDSLRRSATFREMSWTGR
jgi:hypothetical protein